MILGITSLAYSLQHSFELNIWTLADLEDICIIHIFKYFIMIQVYIHAGFQWWHEIEEKYI